MEFPNRVLVGYRYITIILKDLGIDGDDGQYSPEESNIFINSKKDPQEFPNTLLHELMHAVWDNYNLSELDKEEKIVTMFANGLTQIFLTNPEVLSYLQGALNNQRGPI